MLISKGDSSKIVLWLQRGRPQGVSHRTVRWGIPLGLDYKNEVQLGIDFVKILMDFGGQVGSENPIRSDQIR